MLKKLYLTLLRPSMWSGHVLGPLLDCVRAIVHNVLVLTLYSQIRVTNPFSFLYFVMHLIFLHFFFIRAVLRMGLPFVFLQFYGNL